MAQEHSEESKHVHDKDLERKILEYIAEHPGSTRTNVSEGVDKKKTTVDGHIRHLMSIGYVDEGLTLTEFGKKMQIKVYIFIFTEFRPRRSIRKPGENYQQGLADEIRAVLKTDEYRGKIYLDSMDIVMGADFDVVVSLRANALEPIGTFVTSFLRSHRYVFKTRTNIAWPTVFQHLAQVEDSVVVP